MKSIGRHGIYIRSSVNGFFHHLSQALAQGPVALATVVDARGSTPRVAGARQYFTAAGLAEGTVGGGVAEARVAELALATLADGQPRIYEADMHGRPGDTRDGVCGGSMTVWIVRLDPCISRQLVDSIEHSSQSGRRVHVSLRLDQAAPLALACMDDEPGISDRQYTEVIEPFPRMLIVGAGHIGRSLAHLLDRLGFVVAVQDGRPEWLVREAFPAGCDLEPCLEKAAEKLRLWEGGRFIALVTRGFPQDVQALKALSAIPDLDYLGMLGSKVRLATVFAACRELGLLNPPPACLHAPIGIEIAAETPEEIAVSISAEIIRVWRQGSGATKRSSS